MHRYGYFALTAILCAFCTSGLSQGKATLLERNTYIKADKNKLLEEHSFLYQIDNKEAAWIADINIHKNGSEKVQVLEAYIMDKNYSVVRKLKKKEIVEKSNLDYFELFSDSYVYNFKLNHNAYPYFIYYKYQRVVSQYLTIANWFPIANTSVMTAKAKLTVDISDDLEFRMDYDSAFDYSNESGDGYSRHIWQIGDLPTYDQNTYAPPIRESIPMVKILPLDFEYFVSGSCRSWGEFGSWKSQLLVGLNDLPETEKNKIYKLTQGLSDKKEIIRILYEYLQTNHRYIYVGIDIGGLRPYPASYVVKNRYGDCKALTNYMKAALEVVGIPSYYTTVYAGSNPISVNENLPGHQSNHVILCVPLEKDTVWLENTSNSSPYNYLGTFTQNRHALLINGSESSLIKTPALTEDQVRTESKLIFNLDDLENLKCDYMSTIRGKDFENLKHYSINSSGKEQLDCIKRILPFQAFNVDSWSINKESLDPAELTFQTELTLKNYSRKLGNMYVVPIPPLDIPNPDRPEKRVYPVRINTPIASIDSIAFEGNSLQPEQLRIPQTASLITEFGSYKLTVLEQDNHLLIVRKFTLKRGEYSLERYPEFYSFLQDIETVEKRSHVLIHF